MCGSAKVNPNPTRKPTPMDEDEARRRRGFESLVLAGIWMLARIALAKGSRKDAMFWRADVLHYMDEHGRPGDEPKKYRREETFPEIRET